MAKFKVGDRARVKYVRRSKSSSVWREGTEVTIVRLLNRSPNSGDVCDCCVITGVGSVAYPLFEQLEPIIDLGSWDELQKTINWNPTKELNIEL